MIGCSPYKSHPLTLHLSISHTHACTHTQAHTHTHRHTQAHCLTLSCCCILNIPSCPKLNSLQVWFSVTSARQDCNGKHLHLVPDMPCNHATSTSPQERSSFRHRCFISSKLFYLFIFFPFNENPVFIIYQRKSIWLVSLFFLPGEKRRSGHYLNSCQVKKRMSPLSTG